MLQLSKIRFEKKGLFDSLSFLKIRVVREFNLQNGVKLVKKTFRKYELWKMKTKYNANNCSARATLGKKMGVEKARGGIKD